MKDAKIQIFSPVFCQFHIIIDNYNYEMGICENKGDKNIVYTTKSLLDKSPGSSKTHLYFSTQPLAKLDGECLLILTHDAKSINTNSFLKGHKEKKSKICKQYANVTKNRNQIDGEVLMLDALTSGLETQKIGILMISQQKYEQEEQSQKQKSEIKEKIKSSISSLIEKNIKSLVITQLQWKTLKNKSNTFKFIFTTIQQTRAFKSVVFVCLNEQTQNHYMRLVKQQNH